MNQQIAKTSQSTDTGVQLSHRDSEVAVALTGRMIKDIDRKYLFKIFQFAIERAYLLIRYEAPVELQLIIDETMKLAQSNYGTIREAEVEIALTRGVLGDYGTDFKGLSVVTFIGFIKSYIKEEARAKLLGAPVIETKLPDYNEIFDISKGNAIKALYDLQAGKDIRLAGPTNYDWLNKLGLITFTGKEKMEFFEEGRQQLIAEFQIKNIDEPDKFRRMDNSSLIDALMSEGPVPEQVYRKVLNQGKTLTLKAFLEGVVRENKNLAMMIEDCRGKDIGTGEITQTVE